MKRSWFGFGLLVALLLAAILSTVVMTRVHDEIEKDLIQAAEQAMAGDWETADQRFLRAKRTWRKWERFRACLADHTPVEEVDADFAAIQVYGVSRQDVVFASSCLQLARQVAAVGEAHEFVWWNIL